MKENIRSCGIYANQFIIAINTRSGDGIWVRDDKGKEYLLFPNIENSTFGEAIVECLKFSRLITSEESDFFDLRKVSERYKEWVGRLLAFTSIKTNERLFKPMYSLSVEERNGVITFIPLDQVKREAWNGNRISQADYVEISISSSLEGIGIAAHIALSRCKSIYSK